MFDKRRAQFAELASSGVPAVWLAWPTMRCGGGQIKMAGARHHADGLRSVRATVGPLVMAQLGIEAEGQYASAVRVYVVGKVLGSIPHELGDKFRAVVTQLQASGSPATCRAQLDEGEWVDVWLDARPEPRSADDPFLPPLSSSTVRLYPGEAERLDEGLHSRAKSKRFVVLGELPFADGAWQLTIDGTRMGMIDDRNSALEAARDGGFPLTCQVRILREQGKHLRVIADLPPEAS